MKTLVILICLGSLCIGTFVIAQGMKSPPLPPMFPGPAMCCPVPTCEFTNTVLPQAAARFSDGAKTEYRYVCPVCATQFRVIQ